MIGTRLRLAAAIAAWLAAVNSGSVDSIDNASAAASAGDWSVVKRNTVALGAASLLAPHALPISTSSSRSTRYSRASASAADDEEDADGDDRNARGAGWWAERQGPWQALVVRCAALPYTSTLNVTVVF